ncbi:hypothetical protein HHK36_021925 [Tetracentron sinense]|uniref:Pectinesterase n=1 Tax=Tetracentron sinense TaxID=13715 RepID=A0A835D7I6_TETSI|nr:hypothetical protein HHK36_021925 [Tetracentron sinense]
MTCKMAGNLNGFAFPATLLTILLLFASTVISHDDDTTPIPADSSKMDAWIRDTIRAYTERVAEIEKGIDVSLEAAIVAAEKAVKVIKVMKDGTGDFRTVTDAIKSIPSGNTRRTIIWIGHGEYREKITIDRTKPFITFLGSPKNMPTVTYDGTAFQYGTLYSATVAVESDYFMAVNIIFKNSAPMPDGKRLGAQAVAMRISGDKAAFYNCKFLGFQDTLCDDKGKHFFKDCYIEGTVDFIFGNGKSIYLNTEIRSVAEDIAVITAHARETDADDSGFTFIHCNITGTGNTYLGRAWKERARVVFAYTYMGTLVNREGWSDGNHLERDKTVYYGEYKCMGPGASSGGRVKYTKILSDAEAKPFLSMTYIHSITWLLPPPKLLIKTPN